MSFGSIRKYRGLSRFSGFSGQTFSIESAKSIFSLCEARAPEFDINVLMAGFILPPLLTCVKWNGYAIKILSGFETKELENGGSQVSMRRNTGRDLSPWNSGTTNHERDVYVFLIAARLARWQTVLSYVETIVATVYQVRIVQDVMLVEYRNNSLHELVDGLKSPKSQAIKLIIILDMALVQSI